MYDDLKDAQNVFFLEGKAANKEQMSLMMEKWVFADFWLVVSFLN